MPKTIVDIPKPLIELFDEYRKAIKYRDGSSVGYTNAKLIVEMANLGVDGFKSSTKLIRDQGTENRLQKQRERLNKKFE